MNEFEMRFICDWFCFGKYNSNLKINYLWHMKLLNSTIIQDHCFQRKRDQFFISSQFELTYLKAASESLKHTPF